MAHRRLGGRLGLDEEERRSVLDGLSILNQELDNFSVPLGLDLIHQFHRLNHAKNLPLLDDASDLNVGFRVRGRRAMRTIVRSRKIVLAV